MSNLKVGMRVVAVTDYPENENKRINPGDLGTIETLDGEFIGVEFDNKGLEIMYSWRIEPLKEEAKQMFNIKTDPWFIRVNSEQEFDVIQDWLKENCRLSFVLEPYSSMTYFTNSYDDGSVSKDLILRGRGDPLETTSRKEIKLTFKTTIDSVQYPIVETEQQIKIKQLQETIDKAARELKELREMGEINDYNSL